MVLYGAIAGLFEAVRLSPSEWTPEVFTRAVRGITGTRRLSNHPEGKQLVPPTPSAHQNTTLLTEVIRLFTAEQRAAGVWAPQTLKENLSILRLLVRIVGDVPIKSLNFQEFRDYKNTLQRLPANFSKNPKYRNKTVAEVIRLQPVPMSCTTLNKNISRVSALLNWCVKQGYTQTNFCSGLKVKTSKLASNERSIFTPAQLQRVFGHEIFTANQWEQPYRFWVPILGLFTGARLNEICQLGLEDIKQISGVWCIDINDRGLKRLKTPASARVVPLHPVITSGGFLQYIEALQEQGETRLFPELKQQRGSYAISATKWFSRFRDRLGITGEGDSPAPCFHSFRHQFATALRAQDTPFETIADLLGHTSSNTTARYSKKPSVVKYAEHINRLDFGLDFTGVRFDISKI